MTAELERAAVDWSTVSGRVGRALEPVRRRWTSVVERRAGKPLRVRPLAAGFWMLVAAGAAAAAIWVTTAWLLDVADDAKAGTERARIRVEAVRTGLAAGAGAAAAVGLMLAFRRQRHAELATALNELDAVERRITELYNAAAEQLGSDKAPVRLTALYTLERLADGNERHRQTIVNIICAYLRMPFTPPGTPTAEEERRERARRHAARYRAARDGQPAPAVSAGSTGLDPHEEHQVRLTAQRLLYTHLQPDADIYWKDISLDLTGATLTAFMLTDCHLNAADFSHAMFIGNAWFNSTAFTGEANFVEATFTGFVMFMNTTFTKRAWFSSATFAGKAGFNEATFTEEAMFTDTIFTGEARFIKTAFNRDAGFIRTIFTERAEFDRTTFSKDAWFNSATFTSDAVFSRAAFSGTLKFNSATFARRPLLETSQVADVELPHHVPDGWRIEPARVTGGRLVQAAPPVPPSV
ncbi:pentapeptide repeat-containing protein [Actinomadura rudentiformis]|uniref:Pentapeptide repeat-containing protein n=1 Tax=Actinomadura rudentiformis TaxID=359158 RepID=A0A6H9YQT0_9ACTN|nr:pentapeptide repeat-containing protein [Actinomadura rudentiformis]KAB2341626.1 pentapeptide repeat-containing protein [Actinomadura rudentiformis]